MPPAGIDVGILHSIIVSPPPAGFGPDTGEAFFQWMAVDHPAWAREQAADAAEYKAWCVAHNGKPPG